MRNSLASFSILLSFSLAACGGSSGPNPGLDGGLDPPDASEPPTPGEGIEACAAAGAALDSAWSADNQHGAVVSMATDPGGKVVLGSVDRSVKVWHFSFGGASPLDPPSYGTPFDPGPGTAQALAFSSDGMWLVGVDDSGAASVWFADVGDLRLRRDLGDTPLAAADMAFGDLVLVADTSFGGNLRVWDTGSDTVGPTLETTLWGVSDILHDLDTYSVFVAGHNYGNPSIERRLDSDPSMVIETWLDQTFTSQVTRIALIGDSSRLVAVAAGMVAVLDGAALAAGPIAIREVPGHEPIAVTPTTSGEWFVTLGAEGTVRMFETDTLDEVLSIPVPPSVGIGLDATGELLVVGGSDGFLRGLRCPATGP